MLTVSGKRDEIADEYRSPLFCTRASLTAPLRRSFQLAEHVEVKAARLENGLLHVDLERVVPEEKKPRRIQINAPELKTIQGGAKAA